MPLVILLYALFASIFPLAKTGLQHVQPFFLVGTRMLFAGSLLVAYHAWRSKGTFNPRNLAFSEWRKLFLLGLTGVYLTNAFEFWGLQYLTTFKTCFIYSLSPFFAALLSYLMFGEKLTGKKWLGLLVGFLGFAPILIGDSPTEQALNHLLGFNWAEGAVIIAAACTVYGWILMRDLVRNHSQSPILVNGLSMMMGGVMSLTNSYFVESWNPYPVSNWGIAVPYALAMILISNFICYNLYGHLLRSYTATFLSFAGFMTPIFTATYGSIFLQESITWNFLASVAIVFSGLVLFYMEELKEGVHTQEPEPVPEQRLAVVGE